MSERLSNAGRTHSIELIFFPLVILLVLGILANEFSASGIQTNPNLPTPFCQQTAICYALNLNGCDASISNCNFTANTKFSFLNQNSPFTALFDGNVLEFANTFTAATQAGSNPTNQPFSFFPNATIVNDKQPNATGGNTFFIGCLNDNHTLWNLQHFNHEKLNCWQFFSNETQVPQLYSKLYNGQLPPTPNNANLNCTVANNAITSFTYQFIGCDNIRNNNNTHTLLMTRTLMLAFNSTIIQKAPNSGNASQTGTFLYGWAWMPNEQNVFPLSPTNTNEMKVCVDGNINTTTSQTTSCQAVQTAFHQTICASNNGMAACNQTTGVGAFLITVGLLSGIVFLILGLGLQFNIGILTAAFGFGSNAQGTRLMQVIGIAIISWTFIYSEFGSSWLPFLPFNLGTIGFLVLTTMFFLGIYWRIFSWE